MESFKDFFYLKENEISLGVANSRKYDRYMIDVKELFSPYKIMLNITSVIKLPEENYKFKNYPKYDFSVIEGRMIFKIVIPCDKNGNLNLENIEFDSNITNPPIPVVKSENTPNTVRWEYLDKYPELTNPIISKQIKTIAIYNTKQTIKQFVLQNYKNQKGPSVR